MATNRACKGSRTTRSQSDRRWLVDAIRRIEADARRSADTHLIRLDLSAFPGIPLYLKDESSHPTGSLKHRLARSLFLHALCSGWIGPNTPMIESSSGSTAVSEAYFARMLGLTFTAVVPRGTARAKLEAIRFYGGRIHEADDTREVCSLARRIALECGGHYLDQFTFAERATDWRSNNNIAESIFSQLASEEEPVPTWIVCGAGTGGTSATIGRYLRYRQLPTMLCVADPVGSVFHRHYADPAVTTTGEDALPLVEGIGRARLEPSFIPSVVDRMIVVDDAASLGAMRALSAKLGRPVGGSTGTNLVACLDLMREMRAARAQGAVVTLLCDHGARYADTYFNDEWLDCRFYNWRSVMASVAEEIE